MSKAFSLIELLVTIAIVGILAGLATAQFSEYKIRAYDTAALSDLTNMKIGQEAYYIDHFDYFTDNTGDNIETLPGFISSDGVTNTAQIVQIGPTTNSYRLASSHEKSPNGFCYDQTGEDFKGEYTKRRKAARVKLLVNDCN